MSFREEPLKIKIYVSFIILLGIAFIFFNVPQRAVLDWPFLFFVILYILFEQLDVQLPRGSGAVSVGFAVAFAIIILFGPEAATWAGLCTFLHVRTFKNFRQYYYKMLFNACQMALSSGLAAYVYVYTGGIVSHTEFTFKFWPLVATVITYFMINTVTVGLAIALSQKISFIGVWLVNFRWGAPNYFAIAPLGILLVVVFINMGMPGVLLLILPLLVARQTFIMYMDMRNQYLSTIKALTKAIDAKDHYTHGHSERVAHYSVMIAQEMKLPEDFTEKLEYLALMHDIGKIGIPETILNKPSKLSDAEYLMVKEHSAIGAEIISNIRFIGEYAEIVRHHHERVDGYGYPDGKTGEQLSLGAKIVCVADAFDAMTTERVYRKAMTVREAVDELIRCSDTQFCGKVVQAFVRVLQRRGEL